jgi:hypothetical protein
MAAWFKMLAFLPGRCQSQVRISLGTWMLGPQFSMLCSPCVGGALQWVEDLLKKSCLVMGRFFIQGVLLIV